MDQNKKNINSNQKSKTQESSTILKPLKLN